MKRLLLLPVYFYRYCISPFLPPRCIYTPTCSSYMIEAVEKHGAFRGVILGVKRILRCHPWAKGCYDPVPNACCSHHKHRANSLGVEEPASQHTVQHK